MRAFTPRAEAATSSGEGPGVRAFTPRAEAATSSGEGPGVRAFTLSVLVALALAPIVAGCGRGEVLGRITGKVTFQGEPVSEGIILFRNKPKAIYMTADLKPDGTYVVRRASGEGLPPGDYEVMIQPPLEDAPMGPALEPPKIKPYPNIPQKYRSYESSGLSVTVHEGENPFDVDMKP